MVNKNKTNTMGKKIFRLFLSIILFLLSMTAFGVTGDVNKDLTINIIDALIVAQEYVGLTPVELKDRVAADVDCKGGITILDALQIAQYYVELITSFPCAVVPTPTPDTGQETYRWGTVAMGGMGFVTGFVTSPKEKNLIYTKTDVGGAYRWEESTKSWIPITDWIGEDSMGLMGVESMAIDPVSPNILYMFCGTSYWNGGKSAILISSDYGNSFKVVDVTTQFKAHGNGSDRQAGERLAVDPNKPSILFCGTRRDGLFKSSDSGLSWTKVNSFPVSSASIGVGIVYVLFDADSSAPGNATSTIYAGVSDTVNNLYVSHDGGATWNVVSGYPQGCYPNRAVWQDSNTLLLTYYNKNSTTSENAGVWKYTTVSGTWSNITPPGASTPLQFGSISVDPGNPDYILTTTYSKWLWQNWPNGSTGWGDHIYLSTDGGATWSNLFAEKRITMDYNGCRWVEGKAIHWCGGAVLDPFNPQRAFFNSGNGIFMTENLGAANSLMKFTVKGLEEAVPFVPQSIPGGSLITVIGDYDGFIHTDIKQYPPMNHKPSMGTTNTAAFAWKKPNIMFRAGAKCYFTEDGGSTWTQTNEPNTDTSVLNQGYAAISADGSVILWTPSSSTTTYRSIDKGQTWSACNGINFQTVPAADPEGPQTFYAYNPSSGSIYESIDGGANFTAVGSPGTGGRSYIRMAPSRKGEIWVPMYSGGLVYSKNGGRTFNKVNNVNQCVSVSLGKEAPGKSNPTVYIWGIVNNGPRSIYRSTDDGATWVRIFDEKHQYGGPGNAQQITADVNVYGRVFMTTVGRGLVYAELTGM